MSIPLATLRRHQTRVVLSDGSAWGGGAIAGGGERASRLDFLATEDAASYLRFWKSDPGAMGELRNALYRFLRTPVFRFSDDDVIDLLASHIARGRVTIAVETTGLRPSGRVLTPRPPTPELAGPDISAAGISASMSPLPASLLPKLEEVQIEGAMVLPEVLQTLEQLDLTMGEIEIATVSLDPAPSGIPPIDSKLRLASGSITATIDGM